MSTRFVQRRCVSLCKWIARTATAYHLWCAEQELRLVDTRRMAPALSQARERNLNLLREYRQRGEFPRPRHNRIHGVPCFIDSAGRQCAVACLIHESGDDAPALKVAKNANFARIREIQFPELAAWASDSGFTKAELARIQPGYPPTPDQLNHAFDFFYAIWLLGSVALVSILVNSLRLVLAYSHRFSTSLIGTMVGLILLGLALRVQSSQFADTYLEREVETYRLMSMGIAGLAIVFAVIPFFLRSSESASTSGFKQRVFGLVFMLILAIAFLAIPALIYLKIIGPASESRFQTVHQVGHQGVVMGVAFSGDGSHIVTAADDGTAILWDVTTGKRLRTFDRGHTDGITSVAMSDDGELMVTGSMDQTAVLWSTSSGEKVRTFRGHGWWIDSVALSRNGKSVLTGSSDKTAILWDAATGEKRQTFQGHTLAVTTVALSADATHVVTGSYDKTAILWDAATGKKIQTFGQHADFVSSVAVSGDGNYVATGSWDKTAVLWDAATGKKIHTFRGHEHRVLAVALSHDANLVVTGSTDNNAILWDAANGNILKGFLRHIRPITCVAMTRDGKRLVTGSGDFTAILWDTETGRKLLSFGNYP